MDPYAKINLFTWYKKYNDWIVPGGQYNKKFKNCQGHIYTVQLHAQYPKKNISTERILSNFSGSIKFNRITREVNPEIPIKYYKNQFREHMIRNGFWDIFSFSGTLQPKENLVYISK